MAAEQANPGSGSSSGEQNGMASPSSLPLKNTYPSTSPITASKPRTHLRIQSHRPAPPPPPSSHPLLSPVRTSFNSHGHGHTRTRSIATPYSHTPLSPSPLSSSFGSSEPGTEPLKLASLVPIQLQPSQSAPESFHLQSNRSMTTTVNGHENGNAAPLTHSFTQVSKLNPGAPPPRRHVPSHSHTHGHARIHSRNLSLFFPHPGVDGSTTTTIAEDGTQEVSIPSNHDIYNLNGYDNHSGGMNQTSRSEDGPSRSRHRPKQPPTPLGQGFTFGLRPPTAQSEVDSTASSPGLDSNQSSPLQNEIRSSSSLLSAGTRTRRGHHHKHSLSHNFFSFLEPGTTGLSATAARGPEKAEEKEVEELHTQPTPNPVSQWSASSSPFNGNGNPHSYIANSRSHAHTRRDHHHHHHHPIQRTSSLRRVASLMQLTLGATLWVRSQQAGSIACTGLGYWVVFDAMGVYLGGRNDRKAGGGKDDDPERELERIRQPYGPARLSTVLTFAQAVYLMFSAVYICKETVEHLLLSTGGGEEGGHHHHAGDEDGFGIDFPILITALSFFSVFLTAYLFNNHSKILSITNNRIPPLTSLFRRLFDPSSVSSQPYQTPPALPPKSRLAHILSNPFVACPLLFSGAVVCIGLIIDQSHHRIIDLLLASILSLATFRTAYQACVVLGSVLLQTAPLRGAPSGKMEAFLKVMRELERHPHVLHLPAPHLWQLTPPLTFPSDLFPPVLDSHGHDRVDARSVDSSSSSLSSSPSPSPPPPPPGPAPTPPPPILIATVQIHVPPDLPDVDVLALTKFAWERCMRALLGDGEVVKFGKSRSGEGEGDEEWEREGMPEVTVGIVRG